MQTKEGSPLTSRWTRLFYHRAQWALWTAIFRFCVIEAGRRSGKTEIAKRRGVLAALNAPAHIVDYLVAYLAPTRDQAKAIYWEDLKRLVPYHLVHSVSEQHLTITLVNGAAIAVVGMDKPARIEGRPLDWAFVDEFANMKPGTWERHIRPALETPGRPGRAWLYGVPRPSRQFKEAANWALDPANEDVGYFWWPSSDILSPEAIAAAKRDLDELTYAQEFEAKRVNFTGRVYYDFLAGTHTDSVVYDPNRDLHFLFDFNREPGVAAVAQELPYKGPKQSVAEVVTAIVGEVYIPRNSTTPRVCRKLIEDWKEHPGEVYLWGDVTGGAKGTAKIDGSDWDLILSHLAPVFEGRLHDRVGDENPPQRARVNAVNARIQAADGTVRLLVHPTRAPHVVEDFENVIWLEGGAGEIDKDADDTLTHLSDAIGYYVFERYPTTETGEVVDVIG